MKNRLSGRFKFREGLKWSDGEPLTVDDMLYWWEDLVLNEDHTENPPDEMRSGSGALAQVKKVDDMTLQLVFDVPQTADAGPCGGVGQARYRPALDGAKALPLAVPSEV